MRRRQAALTLIAAATMLAAQPAGAVVRGGSSWLGQYMVRLVGNGSLQRRGDRAPRRRHRRHCARGMRVLAGGRSLRVARIVRSATLDDGRRVHVAGDAAILLLRTPLPAGVSAAPIGDGGGASFTIAGYGTTNER